MRTPITDEPVKVIPPCPHPWWQDKDVQEGMLVRLADDRYADDDRVFRVVSKKAGSATLKQVFP